MSRFVRILVVGYTLLRKHFLRVLAGVVAVMLLGYGVFALVARYRTTHTVKLSAPNTVVTHTTDRPGEAKIDTKRTEYKVAPDMPRRIILPSIGVDGFIQQVGIDTKTNAMAAPTNIHIAGWYNKSVRPGDVGLSIIDGHVQGYYDAGIFKRLTSMKPGQRFSVEFGDRSQRNFVVVSVKNYGTDTAAQALFSQASDIPRQLTLITCGGRYNASIHGYDQRLIVTAKRVDR